MCMIWIGSCDDNVHDDDDDDDDDDNNLLIFLEWVKNHELLSGNPVPEINSICWMTVYFVLTIHWKLVTYCLNLKLLFYMNKTDCDFRSVVINKITL